MDPEIKDDINIIKGRIPNFGIKLKSEEYNAENIMQGIKIFITNLFKGEMSFSVKKLIFFKK